MEPEEFLKRLQEEVNHFSNIISTNEGEWIVKGFIDIYKKIYTISVDTKVVSKVIEILLIPELERFANKLDLHLEIQDKQNYYPDLTFICNKSKNKFAVDIKSTIRDSKNKIKSMTLGTYQGYFRTRDTTEGQNISYPYNDYSSHIVLGVIYSHVSDVPNEKAVFSIDELDKIKSVIKDFKFFAQPKYKIASGSKGSGNTRNIGSTQNISELLDGSGIFSKLGEDVFDDYWMFYIDKQSSKESGNPRPYTNLKSYSEYKRKSLKEIENNLDIIYGLPDNDESEIDE